jgi:beta-lactamase class A
MTEHIRQIIKEAAHKGTGLLGVGFKDLLTGEEIYLNGDTAFPTASVFKIFVLCELFRREQKGTFSFDEQHTLLNCEKSIGSGILEQAEEGTVYSMMDYAMLMMSISDNTASDYLFSVAGRDNIRKNIIEPLGLTNTKIDLNCAQLLTYNYDVTIEEYRKIVDAENGRFHRRNSPYFLCQAEKNNQSSPRDMVKLLSLMYDGKLLGTDSDQRMIDIMRQCKTNARIPAKLPEGTPVAHKTGSIDHLTNDCGIVYTDNGDYVLTLFYNGNLASEEEYEGTNWGDVGNSILSQLSADIYNAYMQSK